MKGLGVSLAFGMMLVLILMIGYWLRTPYAISAQWNHPVIPGFHPDDMMRHQAAR